MATINVLAGDLKAGKWSVSSLFGGLAMTRGGETIDLATQLTTVEQISHQKAKKLLGTVGGGALGLLLAGPVGAIGGFWLGGNKSLTTCTCELRDGRRFIAACDQKLWAKIDTIASKAPPAPTKLDLKGKSFSDAVADILEQENEERE